MNARHPGTITMIDEDAHTEKKVAAAEVPESVAFVGGTPVVKVVSRKRLDGAREIMSYGGDGALLQTTMSLPHAR